MFVLSIPLSCLLHIAIVIFISCSRSCVLNHGSEAFIYRLYVHFVVEFNKLDTIVYEISTCTLQSSRLLNFFISIHVKPMILLVRYIVLVVASKSYI